MVQGEGDAKALPQGHLLRILGLGFGIAVSVGSMIGGGILRTPGSVLNHVPLVGVALALWVLGGVHALLGANVVSEVMTAVPRSGGLFVVAQRAFGPAGGLLVGWTDWLLNAASVAALSIASAEFLTLIFPALDGRQRWIGTGLACLLLGLNWLGVRQGSLTQMLTSSAKGVLLMALILTILSFSPAASRPAAAPAAAAPLSVVGVIIAFQLIIGVYSGWACAACFAEEQTDPGRTIPRALFSSVLLVMGMYVLINIALVHAVPAEALRASRLPLSLAVSAKVGAAAIKIVAGVALVTTLSCLNACVMVSARILQGLGRDRLFPAAAARVNAGGTPDVALAITGTFAILLATTGEFELVFLAVGALVISNNMIMDAALFKLRITEPGLQRPYLALGYPWLPGAALLLDGLLLTAFLWSNLESAFFMIAAVALCIPLSWWARRRQSAVAMPLPG
jgi:APA family basic amino acid/polyamine antiporter